MQYQWRDYSPQSHVFVEAWVDGDGKRYTGLDDGVEEYYTSWLNEPATRLGQNFWCKVIYQADNPFAFIAFSEHNGRFTISEYLVSPPMRGKGYGSSALIELLNKSEQIIKRNIYNAEAVVFPSIIPSQKAFESRVLVRPCPSGRRCMVLSLPKALHTVIFYSLPIHTGFSPICKFYGIFTLKPAFGGLYLFKRILGFKS